jgi:hypothetical protein
VLALLLPFRAFAVVSLTEPQQSTVNQQSVTPEQAKRWEEMRKQQRRASEHLRVVALCSFEYFDQHPDKGFPTELAQIGPEGSRCAPADLLAQSDSGYEFSYDAGHPREGKVGHFTYTAVLSSDGIPDPSSPGPMTIDENGIFSSIGFHYNGALVLLLDVQSCLERYRLQDAANHYPENVTEVLAMKGDYRRKCVHDFLIDDMLADWPAGHAVLYRGYELTYSSTGDKYNISARPSDWGKEYFRSYLMDESGIVHATPFNRPASLGDPEIKMCETGGIACSNGPWNFEFMKGAIPKQ